MRKSHTCPVCHKALWISDKEGDPKPAHFPFCCERCKLVDLGSWFDGRYKIISESKPDSPEAEEEGP